MVVHTPESSIMMISAGGSTTIIILIIYVMNVLFQHCQGKEI